MTGMSVTTDRLLTPLARNENISDVLLVIHVTVAIQGRCLPVGDLFSRRAGCLLQQALSRYFRRLHGAEHVGLSEGLKGSFLFRFQPTCLAIGRGSGASPNGDGLRSPATWLVHRCRSGAVSNFSQPRPQWSRFARKFPSLLPHQNALQCMSVFSSQHP